MSSGSSLSPLLGSSAVTGSILKAASENIAVGATLLKRTSDADKQLVQELLPPPPHNGQLDIRA